jgi:hypothetical protein
LTWQFSKEWLSLRSYSMCSGTCKTEKKFCYGKKHFVLFQVLNLCFFGIFIYFITVSESESELFLGFGSGQNFWILSKSDSDPQQWSALCYTRYIFVNRKETIQTTETFTFNTEPESSVYFSNSWRNLELPSGTPFERSQTVIRQYLDGG